MSANRVVTRIADQDDAVSGLVPVALGGTGASTQAGARTNLGLGTASTHAATDFQAAGSYLSPTGDGSGLTGITEGQVTGLTSDLAALNSSLASKAPLASPALTGTPTAPTAADGTNTTQIATTAFVLANAGTGGGSPGGSSGQVQFNNSGAFGGSSGLTWDGTTLGVDAVTSVSGNLTLATNGSANITLTPGSFGQVNAQTLRANYVRPDITPFIISMFGPGSATSDVFRMNDASNGVNRIVVDQNFTLTWRDLSSTSTERDQARVTSSWATSTDATRAGRVALSACDFTGTDREGLRVESDGTQPKIGFFGHAAAARQGTPVTLADVIALLQAYGLCP